VSEWLDLMLEEIARKQREAKEAEAERKRREQQGDGARRRPSKQPGQSK